MIILEGVDGSGKSTLASILEQRYQWPVKPSSGPAKSQAEINSRIVAYSHLDTRHILDRHPVISESIYGPFFGRNGWLKPASHAVFWRRLPFHVLVFCRPSNIQLGVQNNPLFDTPEYVSALDQVHPRIIQEYDELFGAIPSAVKYDHLNLQNVLSVLDGYVRQTEATTP